MGSLCLLIPQLCWVNRAGLDMPHSERTFSPSIKKKKDCKMNSDTNFLTFVPFVSSLSSLK